jgi:hypothetical protein
MRASRLHSSTTSRLFCALVITIAVLFGSAGSAVGVGRDKSDSRNPMDIYDRFAFELEISVDAGVNGPALTLANRGSFVGPGAQDCETTYTFGPGIDVTQRAVVIGRSVWIDDGDGLEKVSRRDFDWESECPSSARFWDEFPFVNFPGGLPGTPETRDGIKVEHVDLAAVITRVFDGDDLPGLPTGLIADRASIWQTKRQEVIVGLDIALRGESEDTCRAMLELDVDDVAPASCKMNVRLDITRVNDRDVTIKGGRSANGRVVKV